MNDFTTCIIFSALALGAYDLFRKHAVRANAVRWTLFFSSLAGALFCAAVSAASGRLPIALGAAPRVLALLLAKSALVGGSWMCVYAAMREIPVSTAAPIRSTAPLWTALGGVAIYGELPGAGRAFGMAVILCGYFMLAAIGAGEGFSFRHKAMRLLIAGTLLGSASALYDKFLLSTLRIPPETTQFWFMAFLSLLYGLIAVSSARASMPARPRQPEARQLEARLSEARQPEAQPLETQPSEAQPSEAQPQKTKCAPRALAGAGRFKWRWSVPATGAGRFEWRWSIPATGVMLAISDALYFHALSLPDAHISVASVMRRAGCVVTIAGGALLFKEKGFMKKLAAVAAIIAGAAIAAFCA